MAPLHSNRILCEDRNSAIYSLHRNTNGGYDKKVKATGVARSTILGIDKWGVEQEGNLHDMRQAGRPTKITDTKYWKVKAVIDENPCLSLQEITT